jgi:methanogenic corrinoid protein MtbC1
MADKLISIGALSQAAGIPTETIRTWERRYAFPSPKRSSGGHRLYDYELIEHLLAIRAALEQGHRPGNVTGLDLKDLLELIKPVASPLSAPVKVAPEYDAWLSSCLEATRKMDTDALQMLLRSSLASLGLQGFVLERCTVLLEDIGERWAQGNLSVAQEHFAASVLESILSEQWRSISNVNRGHLCVLATPPGEQHTLGLHMAACLMAMRGVRIIWLGASMPTRDLCETASNLKADYLCLSFSRSFDKQDAEQVLKTLRAKLEPRIKLLVGGAGAPLNVELAVRFQGLDDLAECFGSIY